MFIDPSWKYRDILLKLGTLKTQYVEFLASFSYARDRNKFIREIKNQVYALKFNENKKDEIWNELNRIGEFDYEEDFEFDDRFL